MATLLRLAALTLLCLAGCRAPSVPLEAARLELGDGTPIAYDAAGEGSSTLVFVHGWACNRTHFTALGERLAAQYRVVALDLPGHGESGTGREAWSVHDLGRDVAEAVESITEGPVVLVGHSMGGPVSLIAAAELGAGRVRGVIAIDALHDPSIEYAPEVFEEPLRLMAEDYEAFWRASIGTALVSPVPDGLAERLVADAAATPEPVARGLMLSFADVAPGQLLAACPAPVVVIPTTSPVNLDASRALKPEFGTVEMPGVGHFPMLERPAVFERKLRAALGRLER